MTRDKTRAESLWTCMSIYSAGSTVLVMVRVTVLMATSVPLTFMTDVKTTELLSAAELLRTTVTTASTRIYTPVNHRLIVIAVIITIIINRKLYWTTVGQFEAGDSISVIFLFKVTHAGCWNSHILNKFVICCSVSDVWRFRFRC